MILKRFHSYRKLAQSTIEYAVLIAVFCAAVLLMFQYTKAGIRAKFKFLGDEMRAGMSEEFMRCSWTMWNDTEAYEANWTCNDCCEGGTEKECWYVPALLCPEGSWVAAIEQKRLRDENGDRDWSNYRLYCCGHR